MTTAEKSRLARDIIRHNDINRILRYCGRITQTDGLYLSRLHEQWDRLKAYGKHENHLPIPAPRESPESGAEATTEGYVNSAKE